MDNLDWECLFLECEKSFPSLLWTPHQTIYQHLIPCVCFQILLSGSEDEVHWFSAAFVCFGLRGFHILFNDRKLSVWLFPRTPCEAKISSFPTHFPAPTFTALIFKFINQALWFFFKDLQWSLKHSQPKLLQSFPLEHRFDGSYRLIMLVNEEFALILHALFRLSRPVYDMFPLSAGFLLVHSTEMKSSPLRW